MGTVEISDHGASIFSTPVQLNSTPSAALAEWLVLAASYLQQSTLCQAHDPQLLLGLRPTDPCCGRGCRGQAASTRRRGAESEPSYRAARFNLLQTSCQCYDQARSCRFQALALGLFLSPERNRLCLQAPRPSSFTLHPAGTGKSPFCLLALPVCAVTELEIQGDPSLPVRVWGGLLLSPLISPCLHTFEQLG